MAGRDELLELLRPPAHRGPLIAAGAVVLTVGDRARRAAARRRAARRSSTSSSWGSPPRSSSGSALQAERDGGAPAPPQSVLLVCGLLLLWAGAAAARRPARRGLPASFPAATLVWTSLVVAAAARLRRGALRLGDLHDAGRDRGSGSRCWRPRTGSSAPNSETTYRWLLLALAVVFALASLVLRGGRPRHAELMVVTGGLGDRWRSSLVAALGALFGARPAVRRSRRVGPAARLLGARPARGGLRSGRLRRGRPRARRGVARRRAARGLRRSRRAPRPTRRCCWWPLLLLLLGGGALAAGLRPRMPLPPEPAGYSVERPLASRTDDDEVTVHVRNDEPPSR